jgi:hypothetical protein
MLNDYVKQNHTLKLVFFKANCAHWVMVLTGRSRHALQYCTGFLVWTGSGRQKSPGDGDGDGDG